MGLLIDTSVLVEIERSGLEMPAALTDWQSEDCYISCVTASEMLHGVHRAGDAGIRLRREAFVETVLATLPVVEIDLATARTHALIWADLAARGCVIGPHDLWLAAGCLTLGLGILTRNTREFARVSGLRVEHWSG